MAEAVAPYSAFFLISHPPLKHVTSSPEPHPHEQCLKKGTKFRDKKVFKREVAFQMTGPRATQRRGERATSGTKRREAARASYSQ